MTAKAKTFIFLYFKNRSTRERIYCNFSYGLKLVFNSKSFNQNRPFGSHVDSLFFFLVAQMCIAIIHVIQLVLLIDRPKTSPAHRTCSPILLPLFICWKAPVHRTRRTSYLNGYCYKHEKN